jgi:hypothetical protein
MRKPCVPAFARTTASAIMTINVFVTMVGAAHRVPTLYLLHALCVMENHALGMERAIQKAKNAFVKTALSVKRVTCSEKNTFITHMILKV